MQDNSPVVSFNSNSKGILGTSTSCLAAAYGLWQNLLWFTCHRHTLGLEKRSWHPQGPGQAGFRVTWPGFPPCWLAAFPKQDVPSCSHRAYRWLTTCLWQDGSSLVLGYAQPRAPESLSPESSYSWHSGSPMRSPWVPFTSPLCSFCRFGC